MMPAANQGVGMNMGFPDVCLTPAAPAPLPIPYPNIGMNAMSMPFVPNVLVSMAPAQNMGAKPLMTNGDNAGVAHPLCMQPGGTVVGNPRILLGGMPASHLCVPTQGNNFNNPLGSKLVPSVTNVLLGFAAADAAALRSLAGHAVVWTGAVATLVVPVFGLGTARWVRRALAAGAVANAAAWVLDLRACRGGSLAAAAAVAQALCGAAAGQRPLAVLVDGATASAAEWCAATLRERRGARLVGEPTFGKGRAQAFWLGRTLAASGAARDLCTPAGRRLRRLVPDHAVPASAALPCACRLLEPARGHA
jgi:carboxyl-terminal processing protease